MKKILSLVLCTAAFLNCFSFINSKADSENVAEYPDIVIPYVDVFNAVTDNVPTVKAEKCKVDGVSCMKFVPNTESVLFTSADSSKKVSLDSWDFKKYKIDLNVYKYISVDYTYKSNHPIETYPTMHLLPQKVLKKRVNLTADDVIVQGRRTKMTFYTGDLSTMISNPQEPWLMQIHFHPFGYAEVNALTAKDELYVWEITFSANDPKKNRTYTVNLDGKYTVKSQGEIFTLPAAKVIEGMNFMGYIPASNPGELLPSGTEVAVNSNLTYTSFYLPNESVDADDIVFGSFKDYYNCVVDGLDTGFADKSGSFLVARAHPYTRNRNTQFKLDGWDYGGMRINAALHKYCYVLMKVENANGIVPVMNIMKSDVFTSATSIRSETVLTKGEWCFAFFDLSSLREKLINEKISLHIKQIHFLPFGNILAYEVPFGASVEIDKIIFSKNPLELTLHDGIIKGYGDATFKPEDNITRAEAATLTARLVGVENQYDGENSYFSDVSSEDWFYKSVNALAELGIIPKNKPFRPSELATRAELSDMVYKTGIKKADVHKSFPDLYPYHEYYDSVRLSAGAGIINGYPDGSFRPDAYVTRAEAVKIFSNVLGRYQHVDVFKNIGVFKDVSDSHWCVNEIRELTVRHVMNGNNVITTDASENALDYDGGVSQALIIQGNEKKKQTDELFEERKNKILNSESDVEVKGRKYYVSNSGSDENDGLSIDSPFKTVAHINSIKLEPGDGVFFERGGIWRETLVCARGVTYSAYQKNKDGTVHPKPRFYGSPENGTGGEKWTLVDGTDNIWQFHRKMRDVGGIVQGAGERIFEKVVPHFRNGVFYIDSSNEVFDFKKHLTENLTFFSDIPYKDLKGVDSYGYVYLRCDDGNPGELYDDLEFITTGYGVYFPYADNVIDNLCTMYCHGGINGSLLVVNATIQNCEVGFVGGHLQGYDVFGGTTGRPTRYGNGINFYGACNGYYVYNNYIHDIYDAGISNQYSKGGTNEIRNDNIVYSGNVIERCCYGIEYFMGVADTYAVRIMTNLDINGNIIRDTGCGFGRKDPSASAAIKGWDHNNHAQNFVIRNNIFCNSYAYLYHIGAAYDKWLPEFSGNVYVQKAGALFGRYGRNPTTLYDFNFEVRERVSKALKEENGEYYFFDERVLK